MPLALAPVTAPGANGACRLLFWVTPGDATGSTLPSVRKAMVATSSGSTLATTRVPSGATDMNYAVARISGAVVRNGVGLDGDQPLVVVADGRRHAARRVGFGLVVVLLPQQVLTRWGAADHDRMVVGAVAAVAEQEAVASLPTQGLHHGDHRVAHVVADRSAAEGQAAVDGRRFLRRPAQHPAGHLGHTGEAGIQLHVTGDRRR